MNGSTGGEPKLVIPGLAGFYAAVNDIAYTFLRVVIGTMFVVHGWNKFSSGAQNVANGVMTRSGLEPGWLFANTAIYLELIAGPCIIVGLFTRFFGAALAIEMLIAFIFAHWPRGYGIGGGGYEYVLLIGATMFLVAIRGGGPYSADRVIGKEL